MCAQVSRHPAALRGRENKGGPARLLRFRYPLLLATLALSAGYLVVGLAPRVPRPLEHVSDIVLHAVAYAVLGSAATATAVAFGLRARAAVVAGVAFAVGHGALLEFLQYFAPPRQAEAMDLLVDIFGAVAGVAPWSHWRRGG